MSTPHILVVCSANICRSPVAEALIRARFEEQGLAKWQVASAGTWAMVGQNAAPFSIELIRNRGLDIQRHQSRPVTETLLQRADLVLCMETEQVKKLQKRFPAHRHKIYTMRQMTGKTGSIRDPYGGSRQQYEEMVAELAALIEEGFGKIQALAWQNHQDRGVNGSH